MTQENPGHSQTSGAPSSCNSCPDCLIFVPSSPHLYPLYSFLRSSHQDDLRPMTLPLLVDYTLQASLSMWVPP